MTNREKFKEQLFDIVCSGNRIAVNKKTGEPVCCETILCSDCEFNRCFGPCKMTIEHWCNSEYIEPPFDWSKVPVDTQILVRDSKNDKWLHRHFAKFEGGYVYAWHDGQTSWSSSCKFKWKYAKLAEDGE